MTYRRLSRYLLTTSVVSLLGMLVFSSVYRAECCRVSPGFSCFVEVLRGSVIIQVVDGTFSRHITTSSLEGGVYPASEPSRMLISTEIRSGHLGRLTLEKHDFGTASLHVVELPIWVIWLVGTGAMYGAVRWLEKTSGPRDEHQSPNRNG